ncbi:MAG: PRC-barrel domain-containing protein [Rhodoferax sp.]|nr:PRC-barrel domain-containing protein [Rhodoferax sp.]
MLRSMQELKEYKMGATDGEVGHVTDFFFDDASWVIRYLVVETGSWLMSRRVLISPYSVLPPDWLHRRLPVRINREQVKNSPDIDTEKPVSRQHEMNYADYYGYPYYWGGSGFWGDGLYIPMATPDGNEATARETAELVALQHAKDDPHLRSCGAIIGFHIHASDGDIGHVQGMLVDEDTWALRYLVVDTSNWWGGHRVLIAPNWIDNISWVDSKVFLNLTQQAVKSSPAFDSTAELNRTLEMDLHQHYQRSAYWENEPSPEVAKNHDKLGT